MNDNPMTGRFHRNILGSLLCLALLFLLGGCGDNGDKGPAEQAGEKVDSAVQQGSESMKDAMDKTGTAANEAMEGAEKNLGEMSEAVKETTQEAVREGEKMVEESKK